MDDEKVHKMLSQIYHSIEVLRDKAKEKKVTDKPYDSITYSSYESAYDEAMQIVKEYTEIYTNKRIQ